MKHQYGIVNKEVITSPEITIGAKSLYALLCCYKNREGLCFISIGTMAEELDTSASSVKRWVSELVSKKIIERQQRAGSFLTATTSVIK